MAYDGPGVTRGSALGGAVLFGGSGTICCGDNDTWRFLGGQWTRLAVPLVPPASYDQAMAYDPTTGAIVMNGGQSAWSNEGDFGLVTMSTTWRFVVV
jgi:hypothetical protein